MILEMHPELGKLSADEKFQLIQELYEAMEQDGVLEPNPQVVAELHRRREEYLRNPNQGVTWEEVKRKFAGRAWQK